MFYSHFIYVRDGPLAKIWLASHILQKLKKSDITSMDIKKGTQALMAHTGRSQPFALRICGQLMYGLVRIYEKKVDFSLTAANEIMARLERQSAPAAEERAPRSRKSLARDVANGKIELDAADLRARPGAITVADRGAEEAAAEAYADLGNLGAGLTDEMLEFGDMQGMEWTGDLSQFGAPDGLYNHESGKFELTGTQGGEIPDEMEEAIAAADEQDISSLLDEGRRDASTLFSHGDDVSLGSGKDKLADLGDLGIDASGQSIAEFGEDQHLFPADDRSYAGSVPNSQASLAIDAELDERQKELEALKLKRKREAALKKRKAANSAYQPVIDAEIEIRSDEIANWLKDVSDITAQRRPMRVRVPRPAGDLLDFSDHPLMQSRLTTARTLPGLRYFKDPEEEEKERDAATAAGEEEEQKSVHDTSRGLDLAGDMSFGGLDDPFSNTQDPALESRDEFDFGIDGADGHRPDEEMVDAEKDDDAKSVVESILDGESFALSVADRAQLASDDASRADALRWWGEDQADALDGRNQKESIESGWSRRTKRMHAILKQSFTSARSSELSFEKLVEKRGRDTAASSFYQLLVLASSGFLTLDQPASYGDIALTKTANFEGGRSRKLPRVQDATGSTTQSTEDTQASELH